MYNGVVAPKPIATAVVGNSASIAPAESITEPGSTAELPLSTAAAEIECEEGDGKTVSAKRAWTEDEDKMLFCDLCDRGYHIYCVGLTEIPGTGLYSPLIKYLTK